MKPYLSAFALMAVFSLGVSFSDLQGVVDGIETSCPHCLKVSDAQREDGQTKRISALKKAIEYGLLPSDASLKDPNIRHMIRNIVSFTKFQEQELSLSHETFEEMLSRLFEILKQAKPFFEAEGVLFSNVVLNAIFDEIQSINENPLPALKRAVKDIKELLEIKYTLENAGILPKGALLEDKDVSELVSQISQVLDHYHRVLHPFLPLIREAYDALKDMPNGARSVGIGLVLSEYLSAQLLSSDETKVNVSSIVQKAVFDVQASLEMIQKLEEKGVISKKGSHDHELAQAGTYLSFVQKHVNFLPLADSETVAFYLWETAQQAQEIFKKEKVRFTERNFNFILNEMRRNPPTKTLSPEEWRLKELKVTKLVALSNKKMTELGLPSTYFNLSGVYFMLMSGVPYSKFTNSIYQKINDGIQKIWDRQDDFKGFLPILITCLYHNFSVAETIKIGIQVKNEKLTNSQHQALFQKLTRLNERGDTFNLTVMRQFMSEVKK